MEFYGKYINTKSALEIGGGIGYFAFLLTQKKIYVDSIEPDPSANEISEKRYGFKQQISGFEEFQNKRKYDLLYSFHVIEHIHDPHIFLKKLYSLVESNGAILIECPSREIHKHGNLVRTIWKPHLQYFSLSSLYFLVSKYFYVTKVGFFNSSLFIIAKKHTAKDNYIFMRYLVVISFTIFSFYRMKDNIKRILKFALKIF